MTCEKMGGFLRPRRPSETAKPIAQNMGGLLQERIRRRTAQNRKERRRLLETAGNLTRGTLAETYSPNVKAANDWLHGAAQTTLDDAAKRVTVDDYDTAGAVKNSFGSGGYGSLGGLMGMIHSDKAANALLNAAGQLANNERVSTDDGYLNYFTNPRGLLSDLGELGGSMASILPTMALLPEATVARGQARLDALRQGLSPEEADRRAREVFAYNLPLLGRLSTPAQIGGRGLLNSWQQQIEEALQQGAQDEAAEHVAWAGAIPGAGGGIVQALRGRNEISDAGAIGVMQLMPGTAQSLGVDPYDMEQNVLGGATYLKQMYNATGDWDLAHAAYNAGLGKVQKHKGVPPFKETQGYVARINGMLSDHSPARISGQQDAEQVQSDTENYDMSLWGNPNVSSLKAGWSEVLPQIGGALCRRFCITTREAVFICTSAA